jgi:hypothetical protein
MDEGLGSAEFLDELIPPNRSNDQARTRQHVAGDATLEM